MEDCKMPEIANLWTVREVAKHLRLSERTVYKLLRSQELPSIRLGDQYRIPADALERCLTVRDGTDEPDPQPVA